LYDLEIDLAEQRDLASKHPEIVQQILEVKRQHEASMEFAESQTDRKRETIGAVR
jgi:hypothetical protein